MYDFEKPKKQHAILLGGAVIGIISGIPGLSLLNCCCCAGIMAGGAAAVYTYRKEFTNDMPPFESSDALILGVVAGIIGALLATVLSSFIVLMVGPVETKFIRGLMMKLVERLERNRALPAGSMDEMMNQIEQAINEGLTIGGVLRSLVFSLILYPIFSMLGALIGFSVFGKRNAPPQNPTPLP